MAKTRIVLAIAAAFLVAAPVLAADGASPSSALAAARAKISQLIDNPAQVTEVMKGLSAAEQVTFLADLNAAISTMPGSEAERNAAFVAVDNAALAGAQKGNALSLVAEVFATVPPSALPAVTDSLSSGPMNRAMSGGVTFTDEQYVKISQMVMDKVNERVAGESNAGVRSGFAAIMLIRASNTETKEVVDAVVSSLPEAVRNDAKTEWLPAALGKGGEPSYDAILASVEGDEAARTAASQDAQAGGQASSGAAGGQSADTQTEWLATIRVAGAQNNQGVIVDLAGAGTDPILQSGEQNPVVDAMQNAMNYNLPNMGAGDAAGDTATIIDEVTGYRDQTTQSASLNP